MERFELANLTGKEMCHTREAGLAFCITRQQEMNKSMDLYGSVAEIICKYFIKNTGACMTYL